MAACGIFPLAGQPEKDMSRQRAQLCSLASSLTDVAIWFFTYASPPSQLGSGSALTSEKAKAWPLAGLSANYPVQSAFASAPRGLQAKAHFITVTGKPHDDPLRTVSDWHSRALLISFSATEVLKDTFKRTALFSSRWQFLAHSQCSANMF